MNEEAVTKPFFRYHGGKWRLADWIIGFFPPHRVYCEPFGGAASVLLKKPRSKSEIYNDLDKEIVNVFRVMQNVEHRERLLELLYYTPYARIEFKQAWGTSMDPVERARRVIIRAQMGFGSAGATKGSTGFRSNARTKNRYTNEVSDWLKYQDALPAIIDRLRHVNIENRPALDVIRSNDGDDTLFYVDPPYLHETRVMRGTYYRHEMTDAEHDELISCLVSLSGMVIVNGYYSEVYEMGLQGWLQFTRQSRAAANRGTKCSTEVIWLNPLCARTLAQKEMQRGLIA